jgi:hypothetical protein
LKNQYSRYLSLRCQDKKEVIRDSTDLLLICKKQPDKDRENNFTKRVTFGILTLRCE